MNQERYYEIVEDLERAVEEHGEQAHTVAKMSIVSEHELDHHRTALLFGADPYRRDRIWPKDVLENTKQQYPYRTPTAEEVCSLRDLAVLVLDQDIMAVRRGDL